MINISAVIRVSLVFLALSGIACQADDTLTASPTAFPPSMIGTWQVTNVLFDHKDTRPGMGNKYIVPKYLGRIFKLAANDLSINTPYDKPCENAQLLPRKTTAAKLIAKSVSTRLFSPSGPTPEDVQLPLANDTPITALYLSCNDIMRAKDLGLVANKDLSDTVWFIKLENDRLAVSWHEETILILSRLKNHDKAVASFDCSKAGTEVEKAICSSLGLAAYDKSLSQAYKIVREYYSSVHDSAEVHKLKATQIAWIKKRNACGTDTKCLNKAMDDRIDDMIYDLAEYTYQHR